MPNWLTFSFVCLILGKGGLRAHESDDVDCSDGPEPVGAMLGESFCYTGGWVDIQSVVASSEKIHCCGRCIHK